MRKTSIQKRQAYVAPSVEGIDMCVCAGRDVLLSDSTKVIIGYTDFTEEEAL